MATGYHQLGTLAHARGDYDEAASHYQRGLDVNERLGNEAGAARGYSQLGNLEADRGGQPTAVIAWAVKAMLTWFQLGVLPVVDNVSRLCDCRREMGGEAFADALLHIAGNTEATEMITFLLDQFDATEQDES